MLVAGMVLLAVFFSPSAAQPISAAPEFQATAVPTIDATMTPTTGMITATATLDPTTTTEAVPAGTAAPDVATPTVATPQTLPQTSGAASSDWIWLAIAFVVIVTGVVAAANSRR
jgi:hypothetical protein